MRHGIRKLVGIGERCPVCEVLSAVPRLPGVAAAPRGEHPSLYPEAFGFPAGRHSAAHLLSPAMGKAGAS